MRVVSAITLLLLLAACIHHGSAVVRQYYISADEVLWNYCPTGIDQIRGVPCTTTNADLMQTSTNIGSTFIKAQYREYTDSTFSTLKPVSDRWQHVGIVGPPIRAEVGDTIQVLFRNAIAFPTTLHVHGVFYAKDSEGAVYADGTVQSIQPNMTHNYVWTVPSRAGPAPNDPSSIVWLYHGHTDEVADTSAGLVGALIISRAGTLGSDGLQNDVDREFLTYFTIFNEAASLYYPANLQHFLGSVPVVNDIDEQTSTLRYTINGYVYGNGMQYFKMNKGERVRWYMIALGSESDLHSVFWDGSSVLSTNRRTDVVELLPGSMRVADMIPDTAGVWPLRCHVWSDWLNGMHTLYTVTESGVPAPDFLAQHLGGGAASRTDGSLMLLVLAIVSMLVLVW